jgi:hypothetical protein
MKKLVAAAAAVDFYYPFVISRTTFCLRLRPEKQAGRFNQTAHYG